MCPPSVQPSPSCLCYCYWWGFSSLFGGFSQAGSSGFLGHPFPQYSCVKSVNSWNLAVCLALHLPSGDLSSVLPLLLPWVPAGTQQHPCVSADHSIALCLMAALPLRHCSLSYRGFTLSSLYCRSSLVYPSTVMPVAADSLSVSLPWGLDFATHWSLAELVFCPWEDCCKSMVFPSRHLISSVQLLLLAFYCHSCLSLVLYVPRGRGLVLRFPWYWIIWILLQCITTYWEMYLAFHDLCSCLNAFHTAHFLEREVKI